MADAPGFSSPARRFSDDSSLSAARSSFAPSSVMDTALTTPDEKATTAFTPIRSVRQWFSTLGRKEALYAKLRLIEAAEGFEEGLGSHAGLRWARQKTQTMWPASFSRPRIAALLLVVVLCICALAAALAVGLGSHAETRKALVMSGVTSLNTSFLDQISDEYVNASFAILTRSWEIFHYVPDDATAEYYTPSRHGREATGYLTFIIDNYNKLPDYMVFMHGHDREWHQEQPLSYLLKALDLDTVKEEGYVSMRCQTMPGCDADDLDFDIYYARHENDKPEEDDEEVDHANNSADGAQDWEYEAVRGLHNFTFRANDSWYEPLPQHVAAPCCAQFAVTKEAILNRPFEFWRRLRVPATRDIGEPFFDTFGKGLDDWRLGAAYEKLWHVFFGKESVYCPKKSVCEAVQFRGLIECDGVTTDWGGSRHWAEIGCTFDEAAYNATLRSTWW